MSSLRTHERQPPEAIVPESWTDATCALVRATPGPLYSAALCPAHWFEVRDLPCERRLLVGLTDRNGLPCGVYLLCDRALPRLHAVSPAEAAREVRTWLRLRLLDEVACCEAWSPHLPRVLLVQPARAAQGRRRA